MCPHSIYIGPKVPTYEAKIYTNLGTWTLKPYRTLKGPLKGPLEGTLEGTPIWASLVCGPGLSLGEPKGS